MDKETAKFVEKNNFFLKQELVRVVGNFKTSQLPQPVDKMKVTDIASAFGMEEWVLSRLLNLYGNRKPMDDVIEKLSGHFEFTKALAVGDEVLRDIYKHIEELAEYPRQTADYRRSIHEKSFFYSEKLGFIVNSAHRMVTLEIFIQEDGSIPEGDLLIIDQARNIFSIKFVKKLDETIKPNSLYYFNQSDYHEAKLIF